MRFTLSITFACLVAFLTPSLLSASTIIHAGRLIDGRGGPAQTEMSLVIDEGRITRIAKGYVSPAENDRLIKLVDQTVLPGLMDMHTHLQGQFSKDAYTEQFFMDQADYALRSTVLLGRR